MRNDIQTIEEKAFNILKVSCVKETLIYTILDLPHEGELKNHIRLVLVNFLSQGKDDRKKMFQIQGFFDLHAYITYWASKNEDVAREYTPYL